MFIKRFLARLVEKITGRKCSRCHHNLGGRCCHPDGDMFLRCWHGITRPGFEYSPSVECYNIGAAAAAEMVAGIEASGALTEEELHQMEKIITSLQEASETAKDGGLLED